jgi:hypothetical protein
LIGSDAVEETFPPRCSAFMLVRQNRSKQHIAAAKERELKFRWRLPER